MSKKIKSTWTIEINHKKVTFTRLHKGNPIEVYAPVSIAKACIYAPLIIQGYEPLRCLRRLDRSVD